MRGEEAEAIRRTVLTALAQDRTPGWSFTGYFQGVDWPVIGDDSMTVTMPVGPHATDVEGNVEASALLGLIDAAMASPLRIKLAPGARMATTQISVQFTGAKVRSGVRVETRKEARTEGSAMPQLLAHARLYGDTGLAMVGQSSFVQLPPPQQMGEMAPLPWQRRERIEAPPLRPEQLDARERQVLEACEAALAAQAANPGVSFLRHFWGLLPQRTADGAECRLDVGPQLANRVGHVQGGILMGMAAETARCAVPNHPVLSNLSAWFTGPGAGGALLARSTVVHAGRSLAVVRTEITGEGGARVLEATSAHSAA